MYIYTVITLSKNLFILITYISSSTTGIGFKVTLIIPTISTFIKKKKKNDTGY